ncbi:hypothetical protein B1R32_11246 [Abditibacterium utsteinense]|uniref:Intracellular proteinase inhibitor n=1 Tax=Abditibacterium utsteinense TaxID=1960156 RepID=A0A2S8SRF6_9BACT|nr:hypothetical protein [Abditibacterium utsteinense]PQV63391.1 hypothetical protein B1R32_11246 [Abditibacterium utsteinense]
MQKPLHTLFFALILCSACFSQTQPRQRPALVPSTPANSNSIDPLIETREGANLTATMDKEAYPGTEPIKLTIALKNTGTKPFGLLRLDVEWFYVIEVTGPDGKKLPFKKPRRSVYAAFSIQNPSPLDMRDVRPGETQKAVVWLSNLFDMSIPGSYTVTTSTTFRMGKEKSPDQVFVDIKSEPVTVKVTSAPPLSQWLN